MSGLGRGSFALIAVPPRDRSRAKVVRSARRINRHAESVAGVGCRPLCALRRRCRPRLWCAACGRERAASPAPSLSLFRSASPARSRARESPARWSSEAACRRARGPATGATSSDCLLRRPDRRARSSGRRASAASRRTSAACRARSAANSSSNATFHGIDMPPWSKRISAAIGRSPSRITSIAARPFCASCVTAVRANSCTALRLIKRRAAPALPARTFERGEHAEGGLDLASRCAPS